MRGFWLVVLAGCTVLWEGPLTALPWTPDPARIVRLRDANDVCMGRALRRPAIRWSVVPGTVFDSPKGISSGWWEPDNRIYIVAADTALDQTVRHELLHASLGHAGHGAPFRRCGL